MVMVVFNVLVDIDLLKLESKIQFLKIYLKGVFRELQRGIR